jgi:hypothetical protein
VGTLFFKEQVERNKEQVRYLQAGSNTRNKEKVTSSKFVVWGCGAIQRDKRRLGAIQVTSSKEQREEWIVNSGQLIDKEQGAGRK